MTSLTKSIRPGRDDDTAAVAEIHAHHVLRGTGPFEAEPPDRAACG